MVYIILILFVQLRDCASASKSEILNVLAHPSAIHISPWSDIIAARFHCCCCCRGCCACCCVIVAAVVRVACFRSCCREDGG